MKPLTPYLFFGGNCREAMTFYKDCFGGELQVMTYEQGPEETCAPGEAEKDRIMHACLTNGDFVLMASDNPSGAPNNGDQVSITVNCESTDETDALFKALGDGGKVVMPPDNTFWGAYFAMLTDKYGFNWMLNCQLEP